METNSETVSLHEFETQMGLMLASYKQLGANSQQTARKLLINHLSAIPGDPNLNSTQDQHQDTELASADSQLLTTASASADSQLLTTASADNQLLTTESASADSQLLTTASASADSLSFSASSALSAQSDRDVGSTYMVGKAVCSAIPDNRISVVVDERENESTSTMNTAKSKSTTNNNNRSQLQRFVCPVASCQTVRSHRKALVAHVRWQHEPAPVSCLSCRQKLDTAAHYLYHRRHCFLGANALLCAECGARFGQRLAYRRHVAGHAQNRCPRCDCRLSSRKALVKHLRLVHAVVESEKWHACSQCPRKFMKKRSLLHHSKQHASADQVQCERCQLNVSRDDLVRHLSSADCVRSAASASVSNRQFFCRPCQRWFARNHQYQQHCRLHERNTCSDCSASFASKSDYLHHISRAHSTPLSTVTALMTSSDDVIAYRHVCQVCGGGFISHASLHAHLSTHATDELVCFACEVRFTSPLELHRHLRRTACSRPTPRHLACPTCGDKFAAQLYLRRHLTQKHSSSTSVGVCSAVLNPPNFGSLEILSGSSALTSGSQGRCVTSSGESSVAMTTESSAVFCHHSNSSLSNPSSSSLSSVSSASATDPPGHAPSPHPGTPSSHAAGQHVCEHCGLSYSTRSNLARHTAAHWRQSRRGYVCDQCAAAFFTLSALRDHQRYLHASDREHVCGVCSKTFKTSSALSRHARCHSPRRPYRCHCGQAYKRMSHLRRHMLSAHQQRTRTRRVEPLLPPSSASAGTESAVRGSGDREPHSSTECLVYGVGVDSVEWSGQLRDLVVAAPAALDHHTASVAVLESAVGSSQQSAADSSAVVTYVLCQTRQQSAVQGLADADCLPPASSICTHH